MTNGSETARDCSLRRELVQKSGTMRDIKRLIKSALFLISL